MGTSSGYKLSGSALVLGVLMLITAMVTLPGSASSGGGLWVDFPQEGFHEALLSAIVENPMRTHVAASLAILSYPLILTGLFAIWGALQVRRAGDIVTRVGILCMVVGFPVAAASFGLYHVIIHVAQHGDSLGVPMSTQQAVSEAALVAIGGLNAGTFNLAFLGYFCLAAGLSTRFEPGPMKYFTRAVAAIGLVGFIAYLTGNHLHTLILATLFAYMSLFPILIWLIFVGVALFNEHSDLIPSDY